jgi:hypothetical protein
MEDQAERAIQSYKNWIEQFSWNWIGTLKMTSGAPSKRRLKLLFKAWITALRNEQGGKGFRWVSVLEYGRMKTNPHLHVLIGGLRNRMRTWESHWAELGGDAMIRRFDPTQLGILYMLKQTDSRGHLEIELELPKSGPSEDRAEFLGAEPASMLRVEGMREDISLQDLRRFCEDSARILGITLHSVGGIVYALVSVARTEAEVAVKELNQKSWLGRKLRVTEIL